jgi:type I restriction enzyme S subunit
MSEPDAIPIDITRHDWDEVRNILKECIPHFEVWAFGSRVKGASKPYSDLDLAVISEEPLPLATMAELCDRLDDSDLTIEVDVVDWAAADPSFRTIIARDKVVVQKGKRYPCER